MTEFYLTLPSNTHVGNKTSDFRVNLPDVVKLPGDWDVSLAQIQYPKSWNNITDDPDTRQTFSKNEICITIKDDDYSIFKLNLPVGHYDSINDLMSTIINLTEDQAKQLTLDAIVQSKKDGKMTKKENKHISVLKMVSKAIFWDYDSIIKRVTVKFNKDFISVIRLSDHLKYILGFEKNDLYNWEDYKNIAKYPVDLRGGIDGLYVYCDLVENQIIGNVREPLLRILPVQGSYGEIIDQDFVARHYIPVLKKEFSTVQISIKSDRDLYIPFAFGKVIVKLHFRSRDASNICSL